MDPEYIQDKLNQLLQKPGVLVCIIAGVALLVGIILFVMIVNIKKRRIFHKQADVTSGSRDQGHDRKRLVSESSSQASGEEGDHHHHHHHPHDHHHKEGIEIYKVALIDEVKVAEV